MSYDEQPDGDPHGECALEIRTQAERITALEAQLAAAQAALDDAQFAAHKQREHEGTNANIMRAFAQSRDEALAKVETAIKAAVLAEREACVKVCEMCDDVETAIRFIRARGKT